MQQLFNTNDAAFAELPAESFMISDITQTAAPLLHTMLHTSLCKDSQFLHKTASSDEQKGYNHSDRSKLSYWWIRIIGLCAELLAQPTPTATT